MHVERERVERGRELRAAARHELRGGCRRRRSARRRRPGGPGCAPARRRPSTRPASTASTATGPARRQPAPDELGIEAPAHEAWSARLLRPARLAALAVVAFVAFVAFLAASFAAFFTAAFSFAFEAPRGRPASRGRPTRAAAAPPPARCPRSCVAAPAAHLDHLVDAPRRPGRGRAGPVLTRSPASARAWERRSSVNCMPASR